MGKEVVFITDVHGNSHQLYHLVEFLLGQGYSTEDLILGGDYIDRGRDSVGSLELVQGLLNSGSVVLPGNHELMLYETIEGLKRHKDEGSRFIYISALVDNHKGLCKELNFSPLSVEKDVFEESGVYDIITNILSQKPFHEVGNMVFVHGGINNSLENWRETTLEDAVWRRPQVKGEESFLEGKTIAVGHTPASLFRKDGENLPYFDKEQSIWYCDGGANTAEKGRVLGCVFNTETGELKAVYDFLGNNVQG